MNARSPLSILALLLVTCFAVGCVSLDYDLSGVSVPVSAKPADPGAGTVEPFTIEARNVVYAWGLFGHEEPDVASLVADRAAGYDRIADFRVRQTSGFPHWLLAHASVTLIRMRTVVIEGDLVRDAAR